MENTFTIAPCMPIILSVPPANSTRSRAIVAGSGEGEASDKVCETGDVPVKSDMWRQFLVSPCQDVRKEER